MEFTNGNYYLTEIAVVAEESGNIPQICKDTLLSNKTGAVVDGDYK